MSGYIQVPAVLLRELSPPQLVVYLALLSHDRGKGCFASYKTMAESTGMSRGRFAALVRELHSAGLISMKAQRSDDGDPAPNLIRCLVYVTKAGQVADERTGGVGLKMNLPRSENEPTPVGLKTDLGRSENEGRGRSENRPGVGLKTDPKADPVKQIQDKQQPARVIPAGTAASAPTADRPAAAVPDHLAVWAEQHGLTAQMGQAIGEMGVAYIEGLVARLEQIQPRNWGVMWNKLRSEGFSDPRPAPAPKRAPSLPVTNCDDPGIFCDSGFHYADPDFRQNKGACPRRGEKPEPTPTPQQGVRFNLPAVIDSAIPRRPTP